MGNKFKIGDIVKVQLPSEGTDPWVKNRGLVGQKVQITEVLEEDGSRRGDEEYLAVILKPYVDGLHSTFLTGGETKTSLYHYEMEFTCQMSKTL